MAEATEAAEAAGHGEGNGSRSGLEGSITSSTAGSGVAGGASSITGQPPLPLQLGSLQPEAEEDSPSKLFGADGLPIRLDSINPQVLMQIQQGPLFQSFLERSQAAQARARRNFRHRTGALGTAVVEPSAVNQLPCPGWAPGEAPGISSVLARLQGGGLPAPRDKSLFSMGIGSVQMKNGLLEFGPVASQKPLALTNTRGCKKAARERSVNKKFRFRERQARKPAEEFSEQPPPQDIGGFRSTRAVTLGLPVRMVSDEVGIKVWCRYSCVGEKHDAEILALQGQIVRIIEVHANRVKVSRGADASPLLPVQIFRPCMPPEIVRNIPWRTTGNIPEPSDFSESVAALDHQLDPGADPDTPSEAVSMSPPTAVHTPTETKVRRFRTTPAVGWQGVHEKVLRHVLRLGKTTDHPPDGSRVRGRLYEASELRGDQQRQLVPELPMEAEFTLGDGEVPDVLECAVSRMVVGEISAFCCTDASLVQPGGVFNFEAPLGPRECDAAQGEDGRVSETADPSAGPEGDATSTSASVTDLANEKDIYRILLMFDVISVEGVDHLAGQGIDEQRLEHAIRRKEAGTRAFKAGRIRLARERYRRTANLLAVGLMTPQGGVQAGHESGKQAAVQEVLCACWLNAAQCELCLKNFGAAKRYCDAALLADPNNPKGLFRRASALVALGTNELQAIEDLSKVVAKDPNNIQAKKLLRQVQKTQKQQDRSNADLFKKACADLVDDFEAIKARLEGARASADVAKVEEALRDLEAAMPRLSAAKAAQLRLGKCLADLQATPPGGSAAAGGLAAQLLAQVRQLILSGDCR